MIACLLSVAANAERGGAAAQDYWPQWRGPLGTGVAPNAPPPDQWSEDKHIQWEVALPGDGQCHTEIRGVRCLLATALPYDAAGKARIPDVSGSHDNLDN